jgi:hypothetical protein
LCKTGKSLTGEEGKKIRKKTEEADFCYEVGRSKTRSIKWAPSWPKTVPNEMAQN